MHENKHINGQLSVDLSEAVVSIGHFLDPTNDILSTQSLHLNLGRHRQSGSPPANPAKVHAAVSYSLRSRRACLAFSDQGK